ncbi:MAG: shikimate kinase [Flavobacteriaceae bacterium]
MKIVLIGYMASGKSTIGKLLAKDMYLPFIDLDEYIEKKEGKTISEIFNEKGEIYFRYQEHFYLKELLTSENKFILSLGGGTPCYAGNMNIISDTKNVVSIYLQASIKTLVERLINSRDKRPLVSELNEEKLTEFVAKHLFERRNYYEKSNFKINVDEKEINKIVAELRISLH